MGWYEGGGAIITKWCIFLFPFTVSFSFSSLHDRKGWGGNWSTGFASFFFFFFLLFLFFNHTSVNSFELNLLLVYIYSSVYYYEKRERRKEEKKLEARVEEEYGSLLFFSLSLSLCLLSLPFFSSCPSCHYHEVFTVGH